MMEFTQTFIFISIYAVIFGAVRGFQIHEHLTKEQLKYLFKRENAVPEHEMVPVYHTFFDMKNSRKKHSIELKAFGKQLKLYLNPTEGILAGKEMPVWIAEHSNSTPFNINYKRLPKMQQTQIYEDVNNMAVVSVTMNKYGKPVLDGIIGNDLKISSLPNNIIDDMMGSQNHPITQMLVKANHTLNAKQTVHHVVYKIPQDEKKTNVNPKKGEGYQSFEKYERKIRTRREDAHGESKLTYDYGRDGGSVETKLPGFGRVQSLPIQRKVAYPEILVIVDYYEYLAIGPKYEDVVKYVLSYWHAVDLRFRSFQKPQIRLNIVGIIISVDKYAIPYINNSKVGANLVDIDKVLTLKGLYFENEKRFILEEDYDIIATMTSLSLCQYDRFQPNYCDPSPLGYSYEAGACIRIEAGDGSFVESITLLEDNGGFSGIVPSAHEIGHLLGASHDPLTSECYQGYIMSSQYLMTKNNFKWSTCSVNSIEKHMKQPETECLFTKPKVTKGYVNVLPGQLYSLTEQCRIAFNSTPCYYDERVCTLLECYIPGSYGQCFAKSSAAEGSSCGKNKMCIDGKCMEMPGIEQTETTKKEYLPNFKKNRPVSNFFQWIHNKMERLDKLLKPKTVTVV